LRGAQLIGPARQEAFLAQGFRGTFGLHDKKFIACLRKTAKAEHLHWGRGSRLFDRFALIVHQRFDLAAIVAADERIAGFQCAHLDDDRGGRPAAGFHLRFDHSAAGRCRR
jgi:hypothetical protein